MYIEYLSTESGWVEICATDTSVHSIYFRNKQERETQANTVTTKAKQQLEQYFAGERREFDLPLAPQGTAFQQQVWQALTHIPFGQTCSYADIAKRINNPKAVRAVGAANGKNPISIVIPCHRVIGADQSLTGYGGGLPRKAWLLKLENPQRNFEL